VAGGVGPSRKSLAEGQAGGGQGDGRWFGDGGGAGIVEADAEMSLPCEEVGAVGVVVVVGVVVGSDVMLGAYNFPRLLLWNCA
jgi:hypothetical protein